MNPEKTGLTEVRPTSALVIAVQKKSASLVWIRSKRVSISLRFGTRHCPAIDPSVSPHCPLCSEATAERELLQVPCSREQLACFSQIGPVTLSVTVPLPLSIIRVVGRATPAATVTSSRDVQGM